MIKKVPTKLKKNRTYYGNKANIRTDVFLTTNSGGLNITYGIGKAQQNCPGFHWNFTPVIIQIQWIPLKIVANYPEYLTVVSAIKQPASLLTAHKLVRFILFF